MTCITSETGCELERPSEFRLHRETSVRCEQPYISSTYTTKLCIH